MNTPPGVGGWAARSPGLWNNDPPRPPRDGFEWVWYPEGYWAERPLERRSSSKQNSHRSSRSQNSSVGKIFKWSSKQTRGPLDAAASREPETPVEQRAADAISPLSHPRQPPFMAPISLPQSPYLSESAQTAALQHPIALGERPRSTRDTWITSATSAPNSDLVSSEKNPTTDTASRKYAWKHFQRYKVRTQFQIGHQAPLSPFLLLLLPADSMQAGEMSRASANPRKEDMYTAEDPAGAPCYFTQKPIRPPSASKKDGESNEQMMGMNSPERLDAVPCTTVQYPRTTAPNTRRLRKWLMKIPRSHKGWNSRNKNKTSGLGQADEISTPSTNSSRFKFNREGKGNDRSDPPRTQRCQSNCLLVVLPGSTKSYPAGVSR